MIRWNTNVYFLCNRAVGGYDASEKVRLEWIENERLKIQRSCEGKDIIFSSRIQ